jgi:hypothetical protein
MRELVLILGLLISSNAAAQDAPRTQCTDSYAFGLRFGTNIGESEVRRALNSYTGFQDLLINDGDEARPMHRVTAVARYESAYQAEMAKHLLITALLDSEEFVTQFSDGDIDDETFEHGIIYNSGDVDLNQGITMTIVREHASLLVTCTHLARRAEALTAAAP